MNKIFLLSAVMLFSSQGFAFHSVTEVLPSGKILLCKDGNEIRKGDIVEVYSRNFPESRFHSSIIKTGEFRLPEVGQKIKIEKLTFGNAKFFSDFKAEEIGMATITDESLEGESRIVYSVGKSKLAQFVEGLVKISKERAHEIQSDCLVAIPDEGIQVKEKLSVIW